MVVTNVWPMSRPPSEAAAGATARAGIATATTENDRSTVTIFLLDGRALKPTPIPMR
jgi:hypothetical protein